VKSLKSQNCPGKSVLELFFEMEQNLDKILPCISSNGSLFKEYNLIGIHGKKQICPKYVTADI
jgi:hypothetical protein